MDGSLGTGRAAHWPATLGTPGGRERESLLSRSHSDLQIFICGWFIAGQTHWDGDSLWTDHQGSLGYDHLPGLQVPGGHQVSPDVRGAADLVGAALGLVNLPVELLVLPGAVEGHMTARAPLVGRTPTLGTDELVCVRVSLHHMMTECH